MYWITPGRRVLPHCTAVGKALLAQIPPGEARALLERDGVPAFTPPRSHPLLEILAEKMARDWLAQACVRAGSMSDD